MSPRRITYHISISKEQLAELPVATFEGNIHVIDSEEKVAPALEILKKSKIIGFDTETRPSFKKGQSNTVSLMQLCTRKDCFLFRINMIGLPYPLQELLENAGKIKVGLSLHDDFHSLAKITKISPRAFVDLQQYVKSVGIDDNSLSKIYAIVFGKRISKGQRLTNWEAAELTEHQQAYAAMDAMACVQVYDEISKLHFKPAFSPYLLDESPKNEDGKENDSEEIHA